MNTNGNPNRRGVISDASPLKLMKLLKKYVKRANAWLVMWQEQRDRKIIDKREFFIKEIDADNFIKQKNEETKENN